MTDDILARRLFKVQIRKELIDKIKQYQVGWVHNGEIIATKTLKWDGYIFLIPDEEYQELFGKTRNGR